MPGKLPHKNEPLRRSKKTRTISATLPGRFAIAVLALLLRPALQLILRVLEWQALRAARLKRENSRPKMKARLRFEMPRVSRKNKQITRELSPLEEQFLDANINALTGEQKRERTNANKRSSTTEGDA